jgi:hypothetical protein
MFSVGSSLKSGDSEEIAERRLGDCEQVRSEDELGRRSGIDVPRSQLLKDRRGRRREWRNFLQGERSGSEL